MAMLATDDATSTEHVSFDPTLEVSEREIFLTASLKARKAF